MSEEPPKFRRVLFWISMVSGGVSLFLVLGFVGGLYVYGSFSHMNRPGFNLWKRFYRPVLFAVTDSKGYQYSDLDEKIWVKAELESVAENNLSDLPYIESVFIKPDGTRISVYVDIVDEYGIEPVVGKTYEIQVQVTMNTELVDMLFDDTGRYQWSVSDQIVGMRETTSSSRHE